MPSNNSDTDINEDKEKSELPANTKNDRDGVLASLPLLICPFCDKYKTPIEFDMDLHLYEEHRYRLRKEFPGFSIVYSIEYVLGLIKAGARRRR